MKISGAIEDGILTGLYAEYQEHEDAPVINYKIELANRLDLSCANDGHMYCLLMRGGFVYNCYIKDAMYMSEDIYDLIIKIGERDNDENDMYKNCSDMFGYFIVK